MCTSYYLVRTRYQVVRSRNKCGSLETVLYLKTYLHIIFGVSTASNLFANNFTLPSKINGRDDFNFVLLTLLFARALNSWHFLFNSSEICAFIQSIIWDLLMLISLSNLWYHVSTMVRYHNKFPKLKYY